MNGDSRPSRAECADECRPILQPEEKSPASRSRNGNLSALILLGLSAELDDDDVDICGGSRPLF